MNPRRIVTVTMSVLMSASACAANPFLDAKDDKPVSAKFRGTEWGEEIEQEKIPLTARVVTTRAAKMPWGAIFKIEFVDLKSRAPQPRRNEPGPHYFIVTDDRIVLLNTALYVQSESGLRTMQQVEQDTEAAVKKISAMDKAPEFEPDYVYGITRGSFSRDQEDGLWKTTITLKGDRCVYGASHPSGHLKEVVWEKGGGLIEYVSNYGAGREGFRLQARHSARDMEDARHIGHLWADVVALIVVGAVLGSLIAVTKLLVAIDKRRA